MSYGMAAYRIDSSQLPPNDQLFLDEAHDVRDPRADNSSNEDAFPLTRSVLWDRAIIGEVTPLSMTASSNLRLSVNGRTLKLAYRHSSTQSSQYDVFLIGSVVVSSDNLTIKIDRFDPGREVATKSETNTIVKQRLPTAVVPGDYIIPLKVLLKQDDEVSEQLFSSADANGSVMILQNRLGSLSSGLDPSKFMLTKSSCHFHPDIDELVLSFSCNSLLFVEEYIAKPINNIPLIPTALARFLAGPMRIAEQQSQPKSGFLTFDRTRKLLLLLESDPKVKTLPIVGVWISGVESLESPYVWLACLRFQYCNDITDKAVMHPFSFLLVHYPSHKVYPNFYECSPKDIDLNSIARHEIVKVKEEIILQQVSDSTQESICFNLYSETPNTNDLTIRKCISQTSRDGNTRQLTSSTSPFKDNDTEHHPRSLTLQPHAQKPIPTTPSVPDVSLCNINTGCSSHLTHIMTLQQDPKQLRKDSDKSAILPSSYFERNPAENIVNPLDLSIDNDDGNNLNQTNRKTQSNSKYEENLISGKSDVKQNKGDSSKTHQTSYKKHSRVFSAETTNGDTSITNRSGFNESKANQSSKKLSADDTELQCLISDSEITSEDEECVKCNHKKEKIKRRGHLSHGISYARRNKNVHQNRNRRRRNTKPDPYELIQMQQKQLEELQKQVTQLLSERISVPSPSLPVSRHLMSDASIQVEEIKTFQEAATETSLTFTTRSIGTVIGESICISQTAKQDSLESQRNSSTLKPSPTQVTNNYSKQTCDATPGSQSTQETSLCLSISSYDQDINVNRDTLSVTTPQPSLCEVDISCFDGEVFTSPQRTASIPGQAMNERKDTVNGIHGNISRQTCSSESSQDQNNQQAFYETFMTQVQSLLAHQLDITDAEENARNPIESQEANQRRSVYENTQRELDKICEDSPDNSPIQPRNKPQDNSLLIPNLPRIQCDSIWLPNNVQSPRYQDENDALAAAIALKYLPSENTELAKMVVADRMKTVKFDETSYSTVTHKNKIASDFERNSKYQCDMSLASKQYLQRYNLLHETPSKHVEKTNSKTRNVLQSTENRILDVNKLKQLPKLK